MSTAEAMRNADRVLESGIESVLKQNLNVVSMKQPKVERYVAPDPEGDTDRLIEASRKAITIRRQRITQTKKECKATLASLAAAKKEAKAKFDALMADYAEREAEAKAQAEKDVKADEAYISMCEAALSAAPAE